MTRLKPAPRQPVRTWWWNLLAILVSSASLSMLCFQLGAVSGSDEPAVDVARLSGETPIETTTAGSGQASISDRPRGMVAGGDKTVLTGRLALLMNLLLIERGHARLAAVPDYSATFFKQERIGGELSEAQVMRIKLRHQPLSIYIKWLTCDKGRELIYVEGQNDGKMLVHVGGWKARLLPTVKLDPEGARAMQESRHPVTKIGLLEVARRSISYRQRDLEAATGVHCRMLDNQKFDDRDCYCFILEYDRPELSDGYRKVVAYVDKQYSLPVSVKNYGWPKQATTADTEQLDEETLLEIYSYSSIKLNQQLDDGDFDRHNKRYKFR